MDLSKSYVCLPHDLIIVKLEPYGFDSISWKLFHNYFSEWNQTVKIVSAISKWIDILTGIPQGSILGSLIFIYLLKKVAFAILRMIILVQNYSKLSVVLNWLEHDTSIVLN